MIKLFQGDCLQVIQSIPDNSVNLMLTDPPYNASNKKLSFKEKKYSTVNEDWDKNFEITFIETYFNKLKEGGQLLVFCSYHLLGKYLSISFLKVQQIIHWIKKNPVPSFTKVYAPSVEYIVWFVKKGKPYTFNKDKRFCYKNVFETNVNGFKKTEHPTEKPLSIINSLIGAHSNENDLVLDCFAGSGTTGAACQNLNRNCILIEKEEKYCQIIEGRLCIKRENQVAA